MILKRRAPCSLAFTLSAVLAVGCASSPESMSHGDGSGGAVSASGGSKGSGGAAASSGGSKGSGGSSATGGTSGSTGSGGSGSTTAGCTPGKVPTGMLFSPYDAMYVDVPAPDGHEYYLQVNEWNAKAAQTMAYGGDYFFKLTKQEAMVATTGSPVGFPSHFIGSNSGHMTAGSNLPKAVSALTAVPTSWTWDDAGTLADSANNSYNATYDVWFNTSSTVDPNASSPTGGFLMVWYHKPKDAQPIGTITYPAVSIPGVQGTWNVWIGMNGPVPCISYASTSDIMSMSYDLNLFIQDAVKNRPRTIQSSWYLTNVFAGFEIWRGGVNLQSTSFCAVVK